MKAVVYVLVRYVAVLIAALILAANGAPLQTLGLLIIAAAAVCALFAQRRAGDATVALPLAFVFELPGAIVAALIGWGAGALIHQ